LRCGQSRPRPRTRTTLSTQSGLSSGELVDFITGGPLVALVAEGDRAIEAFRTLAGATDPVKALPGTIRGDYALQVAQNIVHGSDSPDSAEREIKIFFPELV
jgi:nucleoside-diphosphate kinase